MYSEEDIRIFKENTSKELKKGDKMPASQQEASEEVNDLRDLVNFHDHRYYVMAEPLVTDFEYDTLFKRLKHIEETYPALADPDSPTQRVAFGLTKDFPSVAHIEPMLSLDNSYDEEDLINFDKKVRDLGGREDFHYTVEPKYDGASISLVYENDRLLRGLTRGDGIVGDEITPNLKVLKTIPLKADFSSLGIHTIEIRGEVVIHKKHFARMNAQREKDGLVMFANPRNTAAGGLRMQDSAEVAKRGLEAVLYHISYAVDKEGNSLMAGMLKSRHDNVRMLHKLGFKVPYTEQKVYKSVKEVLAYCEKWEVERDEYGYEIDGMVIKVDELALEEKLGTTSHHPRWAMAFKFTARQARTKLLNVEYQVGRVGTITPVAKLEPVHVGGVTVSSVSMFNEEFIKAKDIRIGDDVLVERAGDVIPYIAGVVADARDGSEKVIHFPKKCPSCHSELVKTEEEAAWRCVNLNCPAQVYERLVHFVSKDAMDISGFGKANVERFIEKGWLKSVPDIYKLPYDDMKGIEGLGERSVEKLKEAVEDSKQRTPGRLIFGLGIRHVGETTAKKLMEEVHCIDELADWDVEKLSDIPDVGPKVAESIYDFFHTEENMNMLMELKEIGLTTCREKKESKGGKLEGKVFLFTGTLTKFTRPRAKEMVEEAGGTVSGSLSSKVNYLVVGEDPGSKAEKAKKMGTVEIIDEDAFLSML